MIKLKSHAKINLSLDVLSKREDGYHEIESVMQEVGLHDEIVVSREDFASDYPCDSTVMFGMDFRLYFRADDLNVLPAIEDNLVTKGVRALLMNMKKEDIPDQMVISVDKKLPVAAGIAGGSGNAAVAMLGFNAECGYPLDLDELINIGRSVGADVPFSLAMNAYMNRGNLEGLGKLQNACISAITRGIGDLLEPIEPIERTVILMNPGISVSTKTVYEEIDKLPRYNEKVVPRGVDGLWNNIMEEFTLLNYEKAKELADAMKENLRADKLLMSGSGPTMVAYYVDSEVAKEDYKNAISSSWVKPEWMIYITETGKGMDKINEFSD